MFYWVWIQMYPWGLLGFNSTQMTREDIACLRNWAYGSEHASVPYATSMLRRKQEWEQKDGKLLCLENQLWPNLTKWWVCMWLLPAERQLTWYSEEWNSIRKSICELFSSLLPCSVIMYFGQMEFASVQLTGLHEF